MNFLPADLNVILEPPVTALPVTALPSRTLPKVFFRKVNESIEDVIF